MRIAGTRERCTDGGMKSSNMYVVNWTSGVGKQGSLFFSLSLLLARKIAPNNVKAFVSCQLFFYLRRAISLQSAQHQEQSGSLLILLLIVKAEATLAISEW